MTWQWHLELELKPFCSLAISVLVYRFLLNRGSAMWLKCGKESIFHQGSIYLVNKVYEIRLPFILKLTLIGNTSTNKTVDCSDN